MAKIKGCQGLRTGWNDGDGCSYKRTTGLLIMLRKFLLP